MTTEVHAARADTPVAQLVHRLSDKGLHHIPVLDDSRHVLGIVIHSNVIAAPCKRMALAAT
jgi:CBS domain-containing membrane protein